ncbi:hypothetical protein [Klebsiella grimontii]|uniref:hypothetical protein n=1 Tax=Klebsiella grimontii TaxID=2058152 RepID=UPI001D0F3D58|nr:hypothetical protein [Klebsiella grimontii]
MTDTTELTGVTKHANQHRLSRLIIEAPNDELRQLAVEVEQYTDQLIEALEKAQQTTAVESEPVGEVIEVGSALLVEWHKNLEEGTKLYTSPQAPVMPLGLHPDTQKLVTDFCTALAEKLYKSQLKYGYDADWKQDGWPSQCQAHFHQHIAKGDPRDVAAYCAFMWWHGWSTKPAKTPESRAVPVKFPHQTDFDDPLSAYEAIEKCKEAITAAGIKWEAE